MTRAVRPSLPARWLLGCCMLLGAAAARDARATLPGDSILQLPITLTAAQGGQFLLSSRAGQPQLVTMFYANCQYVCPLIVETLQHTLSDLSDIERAQLEVLMVTLDPDRDTIAVLGEFARGRHIDSARWTVARTDAASTRKLAALLNVRYRTVASGEISHSAVLLLLDAQGRIRARSERIGSTDPAFLDAIRLVIGESQ